MVKQIKKLASGILSAANHDFCPGANQYVYWMKRPIGWVVAAIVFSILVGLFVGPQGYVLAAAFGALLVLGLIWPWLSMKGIRCELLIPEQRIWENESFEVIFKVQNYWPMPVFGMMVQGDFLQELGPDEEPIVFSLRRIPAWADTEFRIPVVARRRGILPDGDINIVNGFPFGLTEISRVVDVPKPAAVWPACQELEGQPATLGGVHNVFGSLCDRSGHDGDTIGVRSFQIGDRLRNVHWAQSARSQKLMVRERQTLASTTTVVILDLTPENHVGESVQSSFEWAIRLAASVCWQLHQSRTDIRVYFLGLGIEDEQQADNRLGIERLMNALAGLPTHSQLLDAESKCSVPVHVPFSVQGSAFFVGTNRSSRYQGYSGDVKTIMIDLEGFGSEDGEGNDLPQGQPGNEDDSKVVVTAPGLAAAQLAGEWKRSYSYAAG